MRTQDGEKRRRIVEGYISEKEGPRGRQPILVVELPLSFFKQSAEVKLELLDRFGKHLEEHARRRMDEARNGH